MWPFGRSKPQRGRDWRIPGLGMELTWTPAGGCWEGNGDITWGQYRKYRGRPFDDRVDPDAESLNEMIGRGECDAETAVMKVRDAMGFAVWVNVREKRAGRLPGGMEYRVHHSTKAGAGYQLVLESADAEMAVDPIVDDLDIVW